MSKTRKKDRIENHVIVCYVIKAEIVWPKGGVGMGRLKLLIAEGTEDFRMALADSLRGAYSLRACGDGVQALHLMKTFRPDVVILDLMLPGLDGITLLQRAVEADLRPVVLATTRFHNDYIIESAQELGVGYIMVKPCELRATVARLTDLTQRIHPAVAPRPDQKSYVSNMLLALGIPTRLKGYGYLREAVLLMAKDPGQAITKELYPAVAASFKTETARIDRTHVERSIRSAIGVAWNRRDEQLWQLYFPAQGEVSCRCPSNGEFISRLADSLRQEWGNAHQ